MKPHEITRAVNNRRRQPPAATGPVWFCLASGPSQNQADTDRIRDFRAETGARVAAINNQIFAAPWADVGYSCDGPWWRTYSNRVTHPIESAILAEFEGERLCWDPSGVSYGAKVVPKEQQPGGLGTTGVRSGCNSGHQVANLAYLRGARIIILTGYDMQHAADGKRHDHADHPSPMANFSPGMASLCIKYFRILAPQIQAAGVRVINATRATALDCFERMELGDAFAVARSHLSPATPVPAHPRT